MQDADGIAEVQAFSQPLRCRGPRVEVQAICFIPRADHRHWIAPQLWTTWNVGDDLAVRPTEAKLAIGLSLDVITLLVNGAMVATTEQGEVGERGGAAVGPVLDVMALAEASPTAGKTTAAVPVVECSADRRRNRAGPRADLQQMPVGVVAHHDPARVARQALRRSGRNAYAILEHRLAGLIGVGQHGGIDVDHDLIALARGTGIDPVVERGLGEQGQGI